MSVIETRQLSMRFDDKWAVNDVSLTVNEGEIFGFLGPNGSGKTTTIRLLTGRLTPTNGTATTMGLLMPDQRAELYPRIGVVGDKQSLYERLSARQNLEIFASLHRVGPRRVDELLERFDLSKSAKNKVNSFSLGMRQKLLLARAFLGQPDLLFLDEPTRGLDPHSARILRDLIREERDRGCTIFLTTHYMDEADQLCDRIGLIVDGKLAALDSPSALKQRLSKPIIHLTWRPSADEVPTPFTLDMRDTDTPTRLAELMATGDVIHLRRDEPTLEAVFLALTGADLSGQSGP